MRVLIVDDEDQEAHRIAERLKSILPMVDLDTHIANTVIEALEEVGRNKYDVAITDMMLSEGRDGEPSLPSMGVAFLEQLQDLTPETKIIVYTNFIDLAFDIDLRNQVKSADFLFKRPQIHDLFDNDLAKVLKDFLPEDKPTDKRPDVSLILPARKSIVTVNTRLTDMFRREPQLLRTIDPIRFEELVAELFEEDGYQVVLTPPRADGGKDIYVCRSDEKLEASFLVECKRYNPPNKVGVEIARQLYGVVQHERRSGGVIVTTSYFTRGAKEFAGTVPYQLFLKDFEDLQTWLQKPMMDDRQNT